MHLYECVNDVSSFQKYSQQKELLFAQIPDDSNVVNIRWSSFDSFHLCFFFIVRRNGAHPTPWSMWNGKKIALQTMEMYTVARINSSTFQTFNHKCRQKTAWTLSGRNASQDKWMAVRPHSDSWNYGSANLLFFGASFFRRFFFLGALRFFRHFVLFRRFPCMHSLKPLSKIIMFI